MEESDLNLDEIFLARASGRTESREARTTLTSPAAAICYHLWLRSRWPLAGSAGRHADRCQSLPDSSRMRLALRFSCRPCDLCHRAGDPDEHLHVCRRRSRTARESGFPCAVHVDYADLGHHARDRPDAFGCLTSCADVGGAGKSCPGGGLDPAAAVLWPTAASAAVCVWLQAISWYSRVVQNGTRSGRHSNSHRRHRSRDRRAVLWLPHHSVTCGSCDHHCSVSGGSGGRGSDSPSVDGTTPPWTLAITARPAVRRPASFSSPWQSMLVASNAGPSASLLSVRS